MTKRNIKLNKILKKTNNKYLVNKAIERSLNLKSLQLLRQSIFLVDFFLLKNYRYKRKLCIETSRGRAITQLTKSTRHVFKKYALNGFLCNLKYYSW